MTNLFKKKFMRVPHLSMNNTFREIGRNAFVDWILVLVVSISVGAVLVAGGAYLYWQVSSGKFEAVDSTKSPDVIPNKDELSYLINRFDVREQTSMQIQRGYQGPTDPSLK